MTDKKKYVADRSRTPIRAYNLFETSDVDNDDPVSKTPAIAEESKQFKRATWAELIQAARAIPGVVVPEVENTTDEIVPTKTEVPTTEKKSPTRSNNKRPTKFVRFNLVPPTKPADKTPPLPPVSAPPKNSAKVVVLSTSSDKSIEEQKSKSELPNKKNNKNYLQRKNLQRKKHKEQARLRKKHGNKKKQEDMENRLIARQKKLEMRKESAKEQLEAFKQQEEKDLKQAAEQEKQLPQEEKKLTTDNQTIQQIPIKNQKKLSVLKVSSAPMPKHVTDMSASQAASEHKNTDYSLAILKEEAADIVDIKLTDFLNCEDIEPDKANSAVYFKSIKNALERLCAFTQMVQILAKPEYALFIDCLNMCQGLLEDLVFQCELYLEHTSGKFAPDEVGKWLKGYDIYLELLSKSSTLPSMVEKAEEYKKKLQELQMHKKSVHCADQLVKYEVNKLPEEMGFCKRLISEYQVNQVRLKKPVRQSIEKIIAKLKMIDPEDMVELKSERAELTDKVRQPDDSVRQYDKDIRLAADMAYKLVAARNELKARMFVLDEYREKLAADMIWCQEPDKKIIQAATSQLKKHKRDLRNCEQEIIPIIAAIEKQDKILKKAHERKESLRKKDKKFNHEEEQSDVWKFDLSAILIGLKLITYKGECLRLRAYPSELQYLVTFEDDLDFLLCRPYKEVKSRIEHVLGFLNEELMSEDMDSFVRDNLSSRLSKWRSLDFYCELLKDIKEEQGKISQHMEQLNNKQLANSNKTVRNFPNNLDGILHRLEEINFKLIHNVEPINKMRRLCLDPTLFKDFRLLVDRIIRYHQKALVDVKNLKDQASLLQQTQSLWQRSKNTKTDEKSKPPLDKNKLLAARLRMNFSPGLKQDTSLSLPPPEPKLG